MPRSPSTARSPAARGLAAWLLGALVCAPPYLPAAMAAPEGEQVVHGEASFARDGDLTVIRPSDGAIIEYQGFDILGRETVQFVQPSEEARVLNRVFGDATRIEGTLLANGIVYLVNPAGIFYGRDAVVNVGELVNVGGTLGNEDFLNGVDTFSLTGPVENLGGLHGAAISLLGSSVANHGSILAPDGVIALVAGERVVLTQLEGGIDVLVDGPAAAVGPGIEHTGRIDAGSGAVRFAVGDHYSLALNHQGVTRGRDLELRGGEQGLVQVGGTLDASAPEPGGRGGEIRVLGDRVALVGATLDASGDAGGGALRVGGDLRGEGPLPSARRSFVDAASLLRADALTSGDGGSVVLFAEEAAGFLGRISARGGAAEGDGGFAELSSNGLLLDEGSIDLRAPAGRAGTLLYDPQDIVLQGGTADGSDLPDIAQDRVAGDSGTLGSILFADVGTGATPFSIFESEIEGSDANLVLEARNSITTSGSFDHIESGEGAGVVLIRSGNDLTLRTRNEAGDETGSLQTPGIDLTGSAHGADLEIRTGGDGTIFLETGSGSVDGAEARIAVGALISAGGDVGLVTEDGSIAVGRIETSAADGVDGGAAGDIRLDAGDEDGSGDTSVLVTGDLIAHAGDGASGRGGAGGLVAIRTRPATLPAEGGGGSITVLGDIDSSGGDGPTGGGNAGQVFLQANVQGDLAVGDIDAQGGDALDPVAASSGGNGGVLDFETGDGDVSVGAIDTSGGDSDGADTDPDVADGDQGGSAGSVTIDAGVDADAAGSILLSGSMIALGGAGPVDAEGAGGRVVLTAADAIEHDGDAGPHITTSEDVVLDATDIGAAGTLEIDGGGGELDSVLEVGASGVADVAVTNPGFEAFLITSRSATSDIDVTQGGDEVHVDGDTIGQIDTTASHTDVRVTLQDELSGVSDVDLALVVPTGSIVVGGTLELRSEDDLVIGDGAGVAIEARLDPETEDVDAGTGPTAANLVLVANEDGDLTGAIRSGGGSIDRLGDASEPGLLLLSAAEGIGEAGSPIEMQGGGTLAAETALSGGIHLRNDDSGDLRVGSVTIPGPVVPITFLGVRILAGDGDIEIENAAGDLVIEDPVITPGDANDLGGDVTLRAAAGSAIVLTAAPGTTAVDATGDLDFDGAVTLMEDSQVVSQQGDVAFAGTLDTDPARGDRVRSLRVTARLEDAAEMVDAGAVRFGGDVGVANDLRDLTITGDMALAGDRSLDVTNNLVVSGDIFAAGGDDTASLAILAGPSVALGGNAGVGGRLSAFSIARNTTPPFPQSLPDPEVSFTGNGAQQVVTGAGGIAISPSGRMQLPDRASIWKNTGDLRLESVGGLVNLGPNEKLTVAGRVDLVGSSVELGDVSAFELHVASPDARVRARETGFVLLKSGGLARDGGTDLLANVVDLSSAPSIEGSGPAPRIAASSATNPGALEVRGLSNGIDTNRLFRGDIALDLAILPADPGLETPLRGPEIDRLIPPRTSDESATGSALAPSAEEALAWLRCGAELRDDCPAAPTGSPLDSPRGQDLARRAAALLGGSAEASSARADLARLDPDALRQLAVLLTELRLLGLPNPEYTAVRDALFAELLTDVRPGAPDAGALAEAVQRQARGVPL